MTTASGLGTDQLSDWTSTARTVTLAADDGAGASQIRYSVDGGAAQIYAGAFTVSGAGQHPVRYWSTDLVGNLEQERTGWVNISDPIAQSTGLAGGLESGWRNGPALLTIVGSGAPGPIAVWYQLDGGPWQERAGEASFTVSGAGHHTVDFYARTAPARTARIRRAT